MTDQWGNTGPTEPASQQNKYYERYIQPDAQQPGAGGPGPGNTKKLALIGGGIAAAAVVGIGAAFAFGGGGGSDTAASTTPTNSQTTQGQSTNPTTSSSSTSSATSSYVDPQNQLAKDYGPALKQGWTIVRGTDKAKAAYDIPPNSKWKAQKTDSYLGYTAENTTDKSLITTGSSTYGEGYCAKEPRAESGFVGFVNIGTRDPAEAAPAVADAAAKLITYNKNTKKYANASTPRTRQVMVNGGKTPAVETLINVDTGLPNDSRCEGKKYELRTVAFSGTGVSTMLFVVRNMDATGDNKMPDADITAIINSLRPQKSS